ncbi:MAG TPA: hypothetical protein VF044_03655, partial [Actinomycetota bacterium]
GRRLIITNPRKESKPDRVSLLSKDPTVGFGLTLEDPTTNGGRVRIVSLAGAFDVTREMPPAGWTLTRRGYKYRDASGTRLVIRTGKRLRMVVRGGDFALGGPAPTPIVVTLRVGAQRLCLEFPEARVKSNGRRLIAENASPPAICDEPTGP